MSEKQKTQKYAPVKYETTAKTPWLASYDEEVPAHLNYFQGTMLQVLEETARKYPEYVAYDFMGGSVTYREMVSQVYACARA